ncbi:hypothetical protein E2562_003449 [Oryza meyeriana var. granulata]|uniref:DUF834 domain-containing protein n=1 Tax=Oryza meyeriana var. granulata TaxID=110450 RepID=A0A6G1EEK5_9ORYZ|nr:hypothetical protein E2562_003449 [Oryza meyeriana var. granulata]
MGTRVSLAALDRGDGNDGSSAGTMAQRRRPAIGHRTGGRLAQSRRLRCWAARQAGRLSARPTWLGDGNSTPWCGGVDDRPGRRLRGWGKNGAPRKEERERGGGFGARRDSARRQRGGGDATGVAEETEVPTMQGTERNRRLTHVGGVHRGDDVDAEPSAASMGQRHSGGSGKDGAAAHRRRAALGVAA